jgi:D-serine deaminase-like pyridoxal phosphate-dependent protein
MPKDVTRRTFLTQSAAVGALGAVNPVAGAGVPENTLEDGATPFQEFIGQPVNEVPTPALVIDLDVFERNLATLASFMRGKTTGFRPHGKAHKCPAIAKLQLASGAHGICAAKLGEAEVFVNGGVTDVLLTAEVVGKRKIQRLTQLTAAAPKLVVVVDNAQNAAELSDAALASKRKLRVAIDLNVGQNRAGLDTPEDAVALAQSIAKLKGLEFAGLQAYAGMNMHVVGFDKRRAASLLALERAAAVRRALEKAGFHVRLQSVGGTGTYNIDPGFEGVTEIQPGSYIFMDAHYRRIGGVNSEAFSDFGNSLTVLTTVISHPSAGRAITDGGNKALSTDEGPAELKDLKGVSYRPGGDEYGIILLDKPDRRLDVGDKVEFVVGHCDTTVNLHNTFWGVRHGIVENVWAIEGRGRTD